MQITYDDEKVQEYFEDICKGAQKLQKSIGLELTKVIKKRYNALAAAKTFSIYLSTGLGKPHSLTGDLKKMYGISISANYRLIVEPVSEDTSPEKLKKCDEVIIKGVDEYHGSKNEWLIP